MIHHRLSVYDFVLQGGELFDKIVMDGAFSEQDASKMIRKMTDAIQHLHL